MEARIGGAAAAEQRYNSSSSSITVLCEVYSRLRAEPVNSGRLSP